MKLREELKYAVLGFKTDEENNLTTDNREYLTILPLSLAKKFSLVKSLIEEDNHFINAKTMDNINSKNPYPEEQETEGEATEGEATEDNATQDNTTQDNATQDNATEDNATQDNATQDNTTQDNTTQDNTTQDNATQDNATEDNTTQDNGTEEQTTEEQRKEDEPFNMSAYINVILDSTREELEDYELKWLPHIPDITNMLYNSSSSTVKSRCLVRLANKSLISPIILSFKPRGEAMNFIKDNIDEHWLSLTEMIEKENVYTAFLQLYFNYIEDIYFEQDLQYYDTILFTFWEEMNDVKRVLKVNYHILESFIMLSEYMGSEELKNSFCEIILEKGINMAKNEGEIEVLIS